MQGLTRGNPGQSGHHQGRHGGGYGGTPPNILPTPQPMEYFEDKEKQRLNPKWVDEEAIKWAASFKSLKTTQMRRFYDDLKAIERKILSGGNIQEKEANFERDRALVMLFKAKAVYAEKRKVSPPEFTQFIFNHTASIKDLKDFQAFLKVFEAVVAFHRFYADEK